MLHASSTHSLSLSLSVGHGCSASHRDAPCMAHTFIKDCHTLRVFQRILKRGSFLTCHDHPTLETRSLSTALLDKGRARPPHLLPLRSRTSHELKWIDLLLELPVGYWQYLAIQKRICTLILPRNSTKKHNEKRSHHLTPWRGTSHTNNHPPRHPLSTYCSSVGIWAPCLNTNLKVVNLKAAHKKTHIILGITWMNFQVSFLKSIKNISPPGKEFSALIYSDLWRLWLCLQKKKLFAIWKSFRLGGERSQGAENHANLLESRWEFWRIAIALIILYQKVSNSLPWSFGPLLHYIETSGLAWYSTLADPPIISLSQKLCSRCNAPTASIQYIRKSTPGMRKYFKSIYLMTSWPPTLPAAFPTQATSVNTSWSSCHHRSEPPAQHFQCESNRHNLSPIHWAQPFSR